MSFFKIALDKLFKQFVRSNKRFPTPTEKKQLEDLAVVEAMADRKKQQDNMNKALQEVMDKMSSGQQLNPLDKKKLEDTGFVVDESKDLFKGFQPKVILGGEKAKRVKGGISTQIKLNSARANKQYAKDLIAGKSEEFKQLSDDDRKDLLDLIERQIKKEGENVFDDLGTKLKNFDGDPDAMADGGLATMFRKK